MVDTGAEANVVPLAEIKRNGLVQEPLEEGHLFLLRFYEHGSCAIGKVVAKKGWSIFRTCARLPFMSLPYVLVPSYVILLLLIMDCG